jgi:hypothetical protein
MVGDGEGLAEGEAVTVAVTDAEQGIDAPSPALMA